MNLQKVSVKTTGLVHNFIILVNCWNYDQRLTIRGSISSGVHKVAPTPKCFGHTHTSMHGWSISGWSVSGLYQRTPGDNYIPWNSSVGICNIVVEHLLLQYKVNRILYKAKCILDIIKIWQVHTLNICGMCKINLQNAIFLSKVRITLNYNVRDINWYNDLFNDLFSVSSLNWLFKLYSME